MSRVVNWSWIEFLVGTTGSGILTAASLSFSGGGLGPAFQQASLGVDDGEFIQFSGFDVSYDVVSLNNPGGNFTTTVDFVINWNAEAIAAVPIPAALWLFGSALLGLVGIQRRKA